MMVAISRLTDDVERFARERDAARRGRGFASSRRGRTSTTRGSDARRDFYRGSRRRQHRSLRAWARGIVRDVSRRSRPTLKVIVGDALGADRIVRSEVMRAWVLTARVRARRHGANGRPAAHRRRAVGASRRRARDEPRLQEVGRAAIATRRCATRATAHRRRDRPRRRSWSARRRGRGTPATCARGRASG